MKLAYRIDECPFSLETVSLLVANLTIKEHLRPYIVYDQILRCIMCKIKVMNQAITFLCHRQAMNYSLIDLQYINERA